MDDSDSDSFHSCDEGSDAEESAKVTKSPAKAKDDDVAAARAKEAPPSVCQSSSNDSLPSRLSEKESKPKPKEAVMHDEGWDRFGDDELEADTSSPSGPEADWVNWGDDGKKPKVHRPKHHVKKAVEADEIASDSTDVEEKGKSRHKLKPKDHSLWEWTGFNDVVNAVGGTLSNVVESGLGLPNAEEFARLSTAEKRKILEDAQRLKEPEPSLSSDEATEPQSPSPTTHLDTGSIGGLFSGIVNSGLDVLESLGKKTFETLTVKDDKNERRRFALGLFESSENLSDVLREVRDRQREDSGSHMSGSGATAESSATDFVIMFERADGMFHLEGLEMLSSSQKDEKSGLPGNRNLSQFDEEYAEFSVDDVSECETDDFIYELKKCIQGINLPYNADTVLKLDDEILGELKVMQEQLDAGFNIELEQLRKTAVMSLAKLTAAAVQALHKLAQLILIANDVPRVESLFAFTFILCRRLSFYASQYANLLSLTDNQSVDSVVTLIFLDCTNACIYLQKALGLLRPFFA